MNPKLSVVTVCFNAEQTIEKTLSSVLEQTYTNYEYIIIDGASTDSTNHIIKKYLPMFQTKDIDVKYISEKDDGIFYAMNKAIHIACGEWIAFMNADDSYYDKYVFEDIFSGKSYEEYDVLYGDTNFISLEGTKTIKVEKIDFSSNNVVIVHQSSFVKTQIMKAKLFDTSYELAADYNFFVELWLEQGRFYYIADRIVSNFSTMGSSAQRSYRSNLEIRKVWLMHDIPGRSKLSKWLDYLWWIGVHLGGIRKGRCCHIKREETW